MNHCRKSSIPQFSCAFVERLIEDGHLAVLSWYEERRQAPTSTEQQPNDFNGWSQVAKRLTQASRSAILMDQQPSALGFALVACSIYEEVLPLMKEEIELLRLGSIGVNITQIEAIDIRIQLLNRFGPQTTPFVLDISTIERWFFRTIKCQCIHSYIREMERKQTQENSFHQQFEIRCIQNHIQVIRRLNRSLLSPKLLEWVDACEHSRFLNF